jgi:hypothetical protein
VLLLLQVVKIPSNFLHTQHPRAAAAKRAECQILYCIKTLYPLLLLQVVKIPSNFYTPNIPGQLLPTGQIFRVKGTPYDFTGGGRIGDMLLAADGGPQK